MPFNNTTPESLVARSDSRNPATTCRGMTSSGKPCRRGLAQEIPSPVAQSHTGLLDASSLYCWQHKDQAQDTTINAAVAGDQSRIEPVQYRTSLDSLVGRLGISDLPQQGQGGQGRYSNKYQSKSDSNLPPRKPGRQSSSKNNQQLSEKPRPAPRKQPGFWASLCCMGGDDEDDHLEVVRHKQRLHFDIQEPASDRPSLSQNSPGSSGTPNKTGRPQNASLLSPKSSRPEPADSAVSVPLRKPTDELAPPKLNKRATSTPDTRFLMSFIPGSLPPQIASTLFAELSKPLSPHDEEGYIYIFWLTDSNSAPSSDTAASLLSPPPPPPPSTTREAGGRQRRPSELMTEYSKTKPKTIMLKIGRANNVHRRMNEWTRQCGYNLSLVRWYPYIHQQTPPPPSSAPSSSSSSSKGRKEREKGKKIEKVQHVHRVERLIHLELANARVKSDCGACGKEHREWFRVDASAEGVAAVDEVIRRWVRWGRETPNPKPII